MKVKELILQLQEEDPEANVYGVDWASGTAYDVSVGSNDEDMEKNVYIELTEV